MEWRSNVWFSNDGRSSIWRGSINCGVKERVSRGGGWGIGGDFKVKAGDSEEGWWIEGGIGGNCSIDGGLVSDEVFSEIIFWSW